MSQALIVTERIKSSCVQVNDTSLFPVLVFSTALSIFLAVFLFLPFHTYAY